MSAVGRLIGVGLGPGDPELVTVKAARLVGAADVIAYHSARHGRSIARAIAEPYLREGQIEEKLVYPVTTETTDHPGGYAGAMADFYAESARRLAAHLDQGRDVVLLAEGDPLFFSSYMHMHKRLADRYETLIVPGVTSVAAASAAVGTPLVEGDEVLTILPGTLPPEVLTERLRSTDAAAILKISRQFAGIREALSASGRLDEAMFVERASSDRQQSRPVADVDADAVPYMSLVLVPGRLASGHAESADGSGATATAGAGAGEVVVVGLGPAGSDWLTPQASAALRIADDVVGYGPYVDRVPSNPRQQRHSSDNRVEAERAEFALELARRGRRVAVVSSGDPGVFAMASAVLEVASDYPDVPVRVLPGLTAAQAVAAAAGAPLGHDFCVLSLSDRLKPWEIVAQRLEAAARADLVIAIYNPASKSRREQIVAARDLLLQHRDPATPVVVGRAVGTDEQNVRVLTLGTLDPDEIDMRTLLIVGSSQTRTVTAADGTAKVYTPRRYPA